MRYIARANNEIEGWDIIDTQDWTSDVEDEREHLVVMTVWDETIVERILGWLNLLQTGVMSQLCGCGKPVRYIVPGGDGTADACNKYARCPSWDELKAKYDELREAAWAFAEEPLDRNTYTLDHAKRKRLRDVLSRQQHA